MFKITHNFNVYFKILVNIEILSMETHWCHIINEIRSSQLVLDLIWLFIYSKLSSKRTSFPKINVIKYQIRNFTVIFKYSSKKKEKCLKKVNLSKQYKYLK